MEEVGEGDGVAVVDVGDDVDEGAGDEGAGDEDVEDAGDEDDAADTVREGATLVTLENVEVRGRGAVVLRDVADVAPDEAAGVDEVPAADVSGAVGSFVPASPAGAGSPGSSATSAVRAACASARCTASPRVAAALAVSAATVQPRASVSACSLMAHLRTGVRRSGRSVVRGSGQRANLTRMTTEWPFGDLWSRARPVSATPQDPHS